MASKSKRIFARLSEYRTFWELLYVTALPVCLTHRLLYNVVTAGRPRAWDGSGHYGIAQIYADSIFPDTFGWGPEHFAGMSFPNFYPPLFFWCVALLNRTHIFSFLVAFKLMVIVALPLIPAAVWLGAWSVSNKSHRIAFLAALLSCYPLVSARFGGQTQWASGLDFFSTLAIGLYTQPLGFVLLLAWYATYMKARFRPWRFTLASILLALAVLGNFLNGIMAVLIVAVTLYFDANRYRLNKSDDARNALIAHTLSPIISACLTLFWIVPVLTTYQYFVTRPFTRVVITSDMIVWFVLAGLGFLCWLWRPTASLKPYITTCFILTAILAFAAWFAPRWMPLQANRFSPTLYFLLSVPIAFLISFVFDKTSDRFSRLFPRVVPFAVRVAPFVLAILLLAPMVFYFSVSQRHNVKLFYEYQARLACYPPASVTAASQPTTVPATTATLPANFKDTKPSDLTSDDLIETLKQEHLNDDAIMYAATTTLDNILSFAREHRDGRYLVEIPAQYRIDAASFDGRALNSYLGVQGNETLTDVYREASPNSIFMFPQVGAISFNPDNFGFSSTLGDDIDFNEQPLARHLERIRFLGGRYLVINSQQVKDRLAQEPEIGQRYDFGAWTIFELRSEPLPPVRVLPYRPALLVSDFTVKGRRNNEHNYIRFAEEQFSEGWFDVLLVRSPTTKLDRLGTLTELNQFGALILDTYDCDSCDIVYRQLKEFSKTRPLILLMNDSILFNRIRYSIRDFPMAQIVERVPDEGGAWLDNFAPTRRYQSTPLRQEWTEIHRILYEHKIATEAAVVTGEVNGDSIQLNNNAPSVAVPVLISTTYHPNWQASNSQKIYAANPMFMLTFVSEPVRLTFERRGLDRAGVWASLVTLIALFGFYAWCYRAQFSVVRKINWWPVRKLPVRQPSE